MATYATEAELEAYVAPNPSARLADAPDVEELLRRAERDVDLALGPYTRVAATGLKVDPTTLTAAQRSALSRACCAAAEFRLQVGEANLVGDTDFVPASLVVARPAAAVSPKMMAELAGHALVRRSGTVETPPEE